MRKIQFTILLILLSLSAWAADRYPFDSVKEQERFHQLTQQLRCVVCQNESLADSTAPLANDLRDQLYQMVKDGKSNEDIIDYMTARYGKFVLFKPPLQTSTVLLWALPFVFLSIGFLILWRRFNFQV